MLEDIDGKQMPAQTIFAMSINFLKMEILKSMTKHSGYTIEDVHFIITIPAVWTDAAKQFMRESAIEVRSYKVVFHVKKTKKTLREITLITMISMI